MYTLREKCPNTELISGPYFPIFGPEITPYLDNFHAVVETVEGPCELTHPTQL